MNRTAIWFLGIALLGLSACASKEELRVNNVLGAYDTAWLCTAVDLTAQVADVVTDGNDVVFVTKSENWKDGYVNIGDREVFIEVDSTFSLSRPDYFFAGEFHPDGRLSFTETIVDRENNIRNDCDYLGYLK